MSSPSLCALGGTPQCTAEDVTTLSRTPKPYLNSILIEELDTRYLSTKDLEIADAAKEFGLFDLIFEGTGNSAVVFEKHAGSGEKRSASAGKRHRRG
jgi:hypothetical protein